ncbi:MAG: hypothetical protein GY851_08020, partial [bacterium]|nr:hypothetical protein [bacterium]
RGFWWNSGKIRALMTEMKVDQVFLGHIHGFNTQVVDGVRYTITGGAGASLSSALPEEGQVHNYVVVHVTADGVRYEVVRDIDGTWERESFG